MSIRTFYLPTAIKDASGMVLDEGRKLCPSKLVVKFFLPMRFAGG